jgi:hypothetical protein
MKLYLAVTDNDWFKFLSHLRPDEIKLHSPYNYIVGGGFFVRHSFLPLTLAWDAFGEKNGTPDCLTLRTAIQKYRSKKAKTKIAPQIGCIILSNPFFFSEPDWIDVSDFWSKSVITQEKPPILKRGLGIYSSHKGTEFDHIKTNSRFSFFSAPLRLRGRIAYRF